MSLYGAMVSGILGMQAQQASISAISDNISNVNTVGYKRTGMQFSTLVTDAATPTSYTPGGVQARPRQYVTTQGVSATSTNTTDISIQGNGLFVVSTLPNTGPANGGPATPASGASIYYSRAGNFSIDNNGNLKNAAGYYLQGWPALPATNYTSFATNQTIQQLRTINVAGLSGRATPTTSIAARVNLQASTAVTTTYTGSNTTAGVPAAGMGLYLNNPTAAAAVAPDFQRTFQIYDSQGTSHSMVFCFKHVNATTSGLTNNNGWVVEAYADLNNSGSYKSINNTINNNTPANQILAFNANGTLDTTNSTFLTNYAASTPGSINWNTALGITTPQNISLNFGTNGLSDGFTQFDSASSLINATVNGSVSGTFTGVSISNQGVVQALFDNGTRQNIYQIPLVTFINADGLKAIQGNSYAETQASGQASINVAGTGGAGLMQSNSLEQSNVDLATEFTNMIVTQRAFSANSKTIQTADEMLTEVIQLKR